MILTFDARYYMSKTTRINCVLSLYIQKSIMKIVMIIMAVMTVVYGYNSKRTARFGKYYIEYNKSYGYERLTLCHQSFKCALSKEGQVFGRYDQLSEAKFLEFLKDVISDETESQKLQELFKSYYNEAYENRQDKYYPLTENNFIDILMSSMLIFF
ncbi:uncharacterized protein LOC116853067 [Odontomachus brunneus]|uniref:uncharacterized protein LOC116853067 n=1 Tax=Odontomachus brunneus TaxID=486640 RepID=UPI0013F1B6B1|nr:uncharacterized protein LOC116853067 [Odontomachus brunneus]XP_032689821.1 uncharacterized protein LOC116853067 [Odontomachus brunneus]